MAWLRRLLGEPDTTEALSQSPSFQVDFGGIAFIYSQQVRYEPEAAEWRGEAAPPGTPNMLGDHRPAVYTDAGVPLIPWYSQSMEADLDVRNRRLVFSDDGPRPRQFRRHQYDSDSMDLIAMRGMSMMDTRGEISRFSLSPTGRSIAVVEWLSGGNLTLVDVASGVRSFVCRLEGIRGDEVPLWSPDERWIVLNTDPRPTLVSVTDGSVCFLDLLGFSLAWWPTKGASTLFGLHGESGEQRMGQYDLASMAFEDLGPVNIPDQPSLPAMRKRLRGPEMAPTGEMVIVGSPFGPSAQYQERFASRRRVALLDVDTGDLHHPISPFVDVEQWVEREHKNWRWCHNRTGIGATVEVAPAILGEATLPGEDRALGKAEFPCYSSLFVWQWQ